jgi:hypothetical protein
MPAAPIKMKAATINQPIAWPVHWPVPRGAKGTTPGYEYDDRGFRTYRNERSPEYENRSTRRAYTLGPLKSLLASHSRINHPQTSVLPPIIAQSPA